MICEYPPQGLDKFFAEICLGNDNFPVDFF